MEHKKTYGEKLRKWRSLRGYSQEYMAQKLGLRDAKAYSRYETGETTMTLDFMEQVAPALDLDSVATLLSIDERVSFTQCDQAHAFGSNNVYNASSDREREQLLERIKHLEEEVVFLRTELLARRAG